MQKPMVWNSTAALAGLVALSIYILACTSFSPDDSKVLYVTVNPQSGLTAVAVYDRKTAKSELLFEPSTRDVAGSAAAKPALMRPQWLDGGHDFLTTWMVGMDDNKEPLNLAVVPFDRRGPTRTFLLSNLGKGAGTQLLAYWPAPVAGSNLFLSGESKSLIRLNLGTGEIRVQTNEQEVMLLPSPDNDHLFYLGGTKDSNAPVEFGLLNPDTFARTPLFQFKDNLSPVSLALSRDTKRLAFQAENEKPAVVHLLETGQPVRTLSLASLGEKTEVCVHHFSPKGDTLYGSFESPTGTDEKHADFGFVEIPLDGSAVRKTTLIKNVETGDKQQTVAFFQIDLSHDGKTLAVESVWLAYGDTPIKAEDCALFLVDLSDPQRKVTKVPIPLPPKDSPAPFK